MCEIAALDPISLNHNGASTDCIGLINRFILQRQVRYMRLSWLLSASSSFTRTNSETLTSHIWLSIYYSR
jgi:hypothetical protein